MRRRGKTFLSLFLSAVIVTGQPVLAADFSAGEETFISETTEQEGNVSEASAIFEDTVDSDSEMRYEKYEATVSSEILDLGQTGVNGSGWGWERLEIKNTGTEAWHIKSISELNGRLIDGNVWGPALISTFGEELGEEKVTNMTIMRKKIRLTKTVQDEYSLSSL